MEIIDLVSDDEATLDGNDSDDGYSEGGEPELLRRTPYTPVGPVARLLHRRSTAFGRSLERRWYIDFLSPHKLRDTIRAVSLQLEKQKALVAQTIRTVRAQPMNKVKQILNYYLQIERLRERLLQDEGARYSQLREWHRLNKGGMRGALKRAREANLWGARKRVEESAELQILELENKILAETNWHSPVASAFLQLV